MALIRIDYAQGKAVEFEQHAGRIAQRTHRAASDALADENISVRAVPAEPNPLHDPAYRDSSRAGSIVRIQATLDEIPPPDSVCPFYAMLTARLCAALAVEPEQVLINWAEVKKEKWSFGRVRAPG
jgi:hypothetical protein